MTKTLKRQEKETMPIDPSRREIGRIHFVGIGGIGMSGIAEVFSNQGYEVTGSDTKRSDLTERLSELGIKIFSKHEGSNVEGARVVVVSSAIRTDNPEVIRAKELRIPVIPRAEMLGELMRGKTGISVAGTHGKTSTTSMLATIFTEAGIDPTIVVGGKVNQLGSNAKLGAGTYVVAEADESDGSFLHLPATFGIITNIDTDHLDYYGNLEALDKAFNDFVSKIPFYGFVAVCGEDSGVRRNIASWSKPVITYGFDEKFDYFATDLELTHWGWKFKVFKRFSSNEAHLLGETELSVPGRHNVLNALACIVVSDQIGVDFFQIQNALKNFGGVKRRFEVKWKNEKSNILLLDDYGHHPTEIESTLKAVREVWKGRIISIFQPHRFSRTLHSKDGFKSAFKDSDLVLITEIFAAGEDPIEGVDGAWLTKEIENSSHAQQKIVFVDTLEVAQQLIAKEVEPSDCVVCLGAGSITKLSDQISADLDTKFGKTTHERLSQ